MMLKTIIIDDEPFVRQDLTNLLLSHENVRVAGEAGTLAEARQQLSENRFDLVFLDICLRGGSGFDLIPFIDRSSKIVFVTGHNNYAIKAFEVNALDYLLKPVSQDRLTITLERLGPEKEHPPSVTNPNRIFVKLDSGGRYISFGDIAAISSIGGNYLTLYLKQNEKLLCRNTLKSWEDLLPSSSFLRIHRSTIINIDHIKEISLETSGAYRIFLLNQTQPFMTSRRAASRLKLLVR